MALATAGCVQYTAPRFDTYVAPRDTLDLRSRRIAVVPLSVPAEIDDPDPVIAQFGGIIEQLLTDNGVDVVPAREYRQIWSRLTQEAGGFYDPFTGVRDETRYQAAVTQLMKEMHERFEPDAFLYPEFWVVEAPLFSGSAQWDGATRMMWPEPVGIDAVWALTFAVVIEDSSGKELFVNGHGLELMEKLDVDSGEMVMIPRAELFRESEAYEEAMAAVFAPLLSTLRDPVSR